MSDTITELLTAVRTIAVVGASADPARPSHSITRFLIDAGYDVRPVNPGLTELFDLPAYPDLDACGPVDLVDVFRHPEAVPEVIEAAVRVGAGAVWLQPGAENAVAAELARAAGITVVSGPCIRSELQLRAARR